MPDDSDPKEFDTAARDAVRRKIIQYMVSHKIGVIRLADRITDANPHKPEIPVKTLQRFLAGRHRTNDMYVGFFRRFAEGLPDPDPIGELGRSMAEMYGSVDVSTITGPQSQQSYAVLAERDAAYSDMTVASEGRFRRLQEIVSGAGHALYDGAMVYTGSAQLAVLKDRLLGLPKTYIFRTGLNGLSGQGIDTDINGDQTIHQVRLIGKPNE